MDPARPSPHAAALALAVAVLVLAVGSLRPDTVIGEDGLVQIAVVGQLRNGVWPPAHPLHLGAPIPFAWGWHVALAVIVDVLHVPVHAAATVVGAIAAGAMVGAGYAASGLWTRRPSMQAAFAVLAFALAAPWRGWWLAIAADAPLPAGLFGAFLASGPRPAGLAFAGATLVLLGRMTWDTRARAVGSGLATLLSAAVWWPAAVALAVGALGSALVAVLEHGPTRRFGLIAHQAAPPLAVIAVVAAIAPWMALPAEAFSLVAPGELGGRLLGVAPCGAIVAVGIARWAALNRPARQLVSTATAFVCAAVMFTRGDGADAVFGLALGVISSPLLLALLDEGFPGWRTTGGPGAVRRDWIASLALAAGIVAIAVDIGARVAEPVVYRDDYGAIVPVGGQERAATYRWVRARAPDDAILLVPVGRAVEAAALTGRRVVVGPGSSHTADIVDHDELIARTTAVIRGLTTCTATPAQIARMSALPAPWPVSLYAIVPRSPGSEACDDLPPGVARVYDNGREAVYVLRMRER